MNKKITISFIVGIIFIIGLVGIFLNAKKTKTNDDVNKKILTEQKQTVVTQPLVENNTALKSCANDGVCEDGYICYHSQYGGMGPYGVVSGEEEGDLLCHKSCNSDNDCGIEKCKDVGILGGDIIIHVNFCSEK